MQAPFAQKRQVMLDKVVAVVGRIVDPLLRGGRLCAAARRNSAVQEDYTSDRDPMNEALEALMTQKLLFNQAQIDSVKVNDAATSPRASKSRCSR
ncbi:MAG: hypothetical protein ACLU9X_03395 [Alistipes shahii]